VQSSDRSESDIPRWGGSRGEGARVAGKTAEIEATWEFSSS
jgi:hypothetical protein